MTTIDWLALELYALGELDADTAMQVEASLATDAVTRERLATIRGDERAVPPFPELDETGGRPRAEGARGLPPWASLVAGAMALAAGLLLLPLALDPSLFAGPSGAKGGELVVSVEDVQGRALAWGSEVEVGTRIQVRATWEPVPAAAVLTADGEEVWSGVLRGGNRERIPGAWTVGDGPTEVCLSVEEQRACVLLTGTLRR